MIPAGPKRAQYWANDDGAAYLHGGDFDAHPVVLLFSVVGIYGHKVELSAVDAILTCEPRVSPPVGSGHVRAPIYEAAGRKYRLLAATVSLPASITLYTPTAIDGHHC